MIAVSNPTVFRSSLGGLRCCLLTLLVLSLCVSAAQAQDFFPGSPEQLGQLHEHFATAVYPYARHGAQPLGITGFEIFGEIAADEDLKTQPYGMLVEGLPADLLTALRVGVRKGLPAGIDVGASYTQVLDLGYEAYSFDVQKAIFKPTALKPGLGLRVAYSKGESGSIYSLEQIGAELIASKGFTAVSIFGGVGVVRSEGDFRFPSTDPLDSVLVVSPSSTDTVLFAGVRVNLLLPKITVAVEKTKELQGVVRIAFGW